MAIDERVLAMLCCPITKQSLSLQESRLITEDGAYAYPIRDGITMLRPEDRITISEEAAEQDD